MEPNNKYITINIIVDTKEDYMILKGFIYDNEIKIIAELFPPSCYCSLDIYLTFDQYKEMIINPDFENFTVEIITPMDFPNLLDGLNNVPMIKSYLNQGMNQPVVVKSESLQKFIEASNELQLKLFKRNPDIIEGWVCNFFMTKEDKIKDLKMMEDYFLKDERYEDCAFVMEIKNKVDKYYIGLEKENQQP